MIQGRVLRVLLVVFLIGIFFSASAEAAPAPASTDNQSLKIINVAQPGHDDYGMPLYLADKLGYFKEEGLKVEFVNFKSSPLSIAALMAKEVQFCLTSYDQALKTFEKGRILKILFTTTEKHPWCLVARPEIKNVKDLKGKSISAKMPGSGPRAFATKILMYYKLDPEKDVKFADLPETALIPAYANGTIDCAVSSGTSKAELLSRGAKVLVDMNDPAQYKALLGTDRYPQKVVLATEEYLKDNSDIAQKFVNAVVRAMKWEKAHKSSEIAQNAKGYFLNALSDQVVDDIRRAFSYTGLVTADGHKAIEGDSIDVGLIEKPVPMEKVVDMSFLKKAQGKQGQ